MKVFHFQTRIGVASSTNIEPLVTRFTRDMRLKMKILVFNGSPKREKNDTMNITRAFLDGMGEIQEHVIHIENVIDKHIEYCSGCFTCMRNKGSCVYDDDMAGILREITESDLLVFSFPLYAYGMPAPMKDNHS